MDYAKVAVNLPLKNLFRQFTYKVPPAWTLLVKAGGSWCLSDGSSWKASS